VLSLVLPPAHGVGKLAWRQLGGVDLARDDRACINASWVV